MTSQFVTFEVDGVSYPLHPSMRAWKAFTDSTGIKIQDIAEADVTVVPELLYYFAQAGCRKEGQEFKATMDEWMDSITIDDLMGMQAVIADLITEKKK
jgi:hypothetical protein